MNDLFWDLQRRYGVTPDRRGECAITCPACGKEPKRGQNHASFSERGFYCFVCSASVSLADLAGVERVAYTPPPARPPRPPAPWLPDAELLIARYCAAPARNAIWRRYKPALTVESLARWQFGYGALPASSCPHARLIVPVRDLAGRVVALKGRRVNCPPDCPKVGAKWLSAAGSDGTALWGADLITTGARVYIAESPVSAALWMQYQRRSVAVATLTTTWRPEWTAVVRPARWAKVIPDHDEGGYGMAAKVERALKAAGVVRAVWRWPEGTPAKWDLADEVSRLLADREAA